MFISGLAATLAAVLVGAGAPASASSVASSEASSVAFSVVTANGSGCPSSTATVRPLPDGPGFAIDFEGYFAFTGEDAARTGFRRNCQFLVDVERPEGMTYAVAEAVYEGFALLSEGVTGQQVARYHFQGRPATLVGRHSLTGPLASNWTNRDVFSSVERVYAPCGSERHLSIGTELRVTPQPPSAELNAMFMDPSIVVRLAWRPCP